MPYRSMGVVILGVDPFGGERKNVCGKTIKNKYIEIKLCLLNVQNANSLPKCLVEIYNRFAEFLFHIKKIALIEFHRSEMGR